MKSKLKIAAVFAVLGLSTACAPAARVVTAQHWYSDSIYYVAYAETDNGEDAAKVRKCVLEGTVLRCEDQAELNRMLNPDN